MAQGQQDTDAEGHVAAPEGPGQQSHRFLTPGLTDPRSQRQARQGKRSAAYDASGDSVDGGELPGSRTTKRHGSILASP